MIVSIDFKDNDEYEGILKGFFNDLNSGYLQFNFSSKSKVRLAYEKTLKYMKDNYDIKPWNLYYAKDEEREDIEKRTKRNLNDLEDEAFKRFLDEIKIAKKTKLTNDYDIKVCNGFGYLNNVTKYGGYTYTTYRKKKFNLAQVLDFERNYDN